MNPLEMRMQEAVTSGRSALLPYFTAGYPDAGATADLVRQADALGAAAVEIGFPYSDSIADGPVIQGSFAYALDHGHTLQKTWELVETLRPTVSCGLIAMASYSLVHRAGLEPFMQRAAEAGFDGVILPDLPVEEATASVETARRASLCHIGLVAPTTTDARRRAIAATSSGFIYQIAVAGTTGERSGLSSSLADQVAAVRQCCDLPVCVGFGISTADHVREVCRVADGAIVGSAFIRRINEGVQRGANHRALIDSVSAFLETLFSGLDGPAARNRSGSRG
jgi:tryptophan synthase alpha chain